ncbi:AT hook DNA-binding motif, partial [Fusarium mundagurra]
MYLSPVKPSSMDESLGSELGRKRRGRPRQYATPQDKTNANVEQRRAKRQKATSDKRAEQHAHFYNTGTLSLPTVSLQVDGGASVQRSDHRLESAAMLSEIGRHAPELDGPDFSHLLPPPTPPLEPYLPGGSPLGSDEVPGVPLLVSGHSEGDTENLAPMAAVDTMETSPPADADHEYRVKRLGPKVQHDQTQREHIGLAAYLESTADICPEVLSSTRIASPEDDLSEKMSSSDRRRVYCGLGSGGQAPHICLNEDERITHVAGVSFDVDSVTGFPSNLAIAKQGIRWSPTQMPVSDLQSDLHLCPRPVQYLDMVGNQRRVHHPVHQIPHYTFGRLIGFEDVSLYLLFPNLYREEQKSSRLRDEDFRTWMDDVLLPIIHNHYSNSHVQHYPSSYDHSKYNATARGIEMLAQRVHPVAREQQLKYYLPPESLGAVWASIQHAVQEPGFRHFRDITVLLQAKNLKVLTKDITWSQTMARFRNYWTHAIDEEYVTADFYFDVGKETCPQQASRATSIGDEGVLNGDIDNLACTPAGTLLYKRCCLQSYSHLAQNDVTAQEIEKQMFYPFSMLHDTGSLTVETGQRSSRRKAGLLYSQFYPSVKEVFAAGNVYPFTNTAIE